MVAIPILVVASLATIVVFQLVDIYKPGWLEEVSDSIF